MNIWAKGISHREKANAKALKQDHPGMFDEQRGGQHDLSSVSEKRPER